MSHNLWVINYDISKVALDEEDEILRQAVQSAIER